MAQKLVETENIEFLVLVQRMQEINRRLEEDTARLKDKKLEKDCEIEEEGTVEAEMRKKNRKERNNLRVKKKDVVENRRDADDTKQK